jgi:BCD family chlorophyll transporter-like MFS transporter
MSERAKPSQRAGAAAITWILMIVGIIITAATSGALLDPFSYTRLIAIAGGIGVVGLLVAWLATLGVERGPRPVMPAPAESAHQGAFMATFRTVWQEPAARLFSGFIFFAMFAYSAQDLILEPFAGLAFGMTPGESTKLSGAHHGGVLGGMIVAALIATRLTVLGTALRGRPVDGPRGKGPIVDAVVESVWPMIATGAVRPVIGARFPIEAAAQAHRALESGETFGKVLLTVRA